MLSRPSEYAIRTLTFLAGEPRGIHFMARDMGSRLGIPEKFLAKVLQPLAARGFLHSLRGRNGGFALARDPAQITLLQIVQECEHLPVHPRSTVVRR